MPPSPQNAEVTETGLKEAKFGKEVLENEEIYFYMKSKFKTSKHNFTINQNWIKKEKSSNWSQNFLFIVIIIICCFFRSCGTAVLRGSANPCHCTHSHRALHFKLLFEHWRAVLTLGAFNCGSDLLSEKCMDESWLPEMFRNEWHSQGPHPNETYDRGG